MEHYADAALHISVDLSVSAGVRSYFAAEHLSAARFMATQCRQREDQLVHDGFRGVDYPVRSYAVTSIMETVAFLEARVNEVWQGAADTEPGAQNARLDGLGSGTIALLRALWKSEQLERSLKILDKYDLALVCASKAELDKSRSPHQDVTPLIRLRNAFVHFKPELQWDNEVHNLKKQLKHRVPTNPLLDGSPWFPHQPLCAGVAEWAWNACARLVDEWEQQLGLIYSYRDALPPTAP